MDEEPGNPTAQSFLPGRNQIIYECGFFKIHQRSMYVTATVEVTVWVQKALPKGGDAQMAELSLPSILHGECVEADKGAWGRHM